MKDFARVTKLSNIGGRADYISNPDRQEKLVATSPAIDWKPYQEFERANQKTSRRNNEGREVILALPNEWYDLPPGELTQRVQLLAEKAAGKKTDMQWAIHWNKKESNLHVHVVFSERQKEKDPKRWDRDVYLTAEGKVARKAADRARDRDGNVLPPVHRKGDLKGGFTAKDARYVARNWVQTVKEELRQELQRLGATIDAPNLLHEYHEGKGKDAPKIRAKNMLVRATNEAIKKATRQAELSPDALKKLRNYGLAALKKGRVLKLTLDGAQLKASTCTLQEHRQAMAEKPAAMPPVQKATPTIEVPVRKAAPAATERPKPAFSLSALQEAVREYYRQTFALYDERKPLDPAVQFAPATLRRALSDLKAERSRAEEAHDSLRRIPFWKKEKKQEATEALEAARSTCERAWKTIEDSGVSLYFDNQKVHWSSVDLEELQLRIERRAEELQREANNAAKFARPADALKGSQEAQKAAETRFRNLCKQIPKGQELAAKEAADRAISDCNYGIASLRAIEVFNATVRDALPEPDARAHERDRSHTPRGR